MATYTPAKKNVEYIFYLSLASAGSLGLMQAAPTLAAGDVKVSTDGGAFANLGTLPTVTPAAGKGVKVTLAIAEMNGDNILVVFSDQTSPPEWLDVSVNIQTSARQIDDLAYPTTSGRSLDVTATGAAGIDWANVENPTTAVGLTGTTIATSQVVASVTGAVGSVTGAVGSVTGAVGSVTGNVGGNVTGSVGSVVGAVGSVTGAVGSVTGNVGGNVNGNVVGTVASVVGNVGGNLNGNVVGSVASVTAFSAAAIQSIWDRATALLTTVGSIGKLIVDNLNAPTGSVPTAIQNADALLTRDLTAVAAPAARSPMNALRKLMNRVAFAAPTLTIYAEDDTTPAYTQTVVQDAAQTPIKSLDTV